MSATDRILHAIKQILDDEQEPNIAKIKSRLSEPTALPTIISTLKKWQHNPELIDTLVKTPQTCTKTEEVEVIDPVLTPILTELKEIKSLLKLLVEQNKN